MFKAAVDALAFKGRLVIIGMMSQYGDGWPVDAHPGLPEKLLKKSASMIGACFCLLCPEQTVVPCQANTERIPSCNCWKPLGPPPCLQGVLRSWQQKSVCLVALLDTVLALNFEVPRYPTTNTPPAPNNYAQLRQYLAPVQHTLLQSSSVWSLSQQSLLFICR